MNFPASPATFGIDAEHSNRVTVPPVRPDIAAFADTLDDTDELYWPALAASDGCEASLRELNAMLVEADCLPFPVEWVSERREAA